MEEAVGNDDSRINCTNTKSLQTIMDLTVSRMSELVDSSGVTNQKDEFISQFANAFKNTLQENIILNGLPLVLDKNKMSSPEKKDHKQMVDEALLSQLSKTVSNVANKRKYCPEQCCRILNMKMKHEIQNLKKAKVMTPSSSSSFSLPRKENSSKKHIKRFSNFCRDFTSLQETVQKDLKEREKLIEEINAASQIQAQQRNILKSIATDETVALKKI